MVAADDMWSRFFDEAGIVPLVVYYEDLLADYGAEIRRVLELVDVQLDPTFRFPHSKFRRQADATSPRNGSSGIGRTA